MLYADQPSSARSIRRLLILGAAIVIFMFTLSGWLTLNARDQAWRRAEQSGANLTLAIESDIKRNISSYDLSLQGAIKAYDIPGIWTVDPVLRQAALFDQAIVAEDLGSMLILDATGKVVADAESIAPRTADLWDRMYFQIQRASDAGLYVSLPIVARLGKGVPCIAMSRRLHSADGSFKGIVVGRINVTLFEKLLANLDLGAGGTALLANINGQVISQFPVPASLSEAPSLAGSENLEAMLQAPSGHFIQKGAQDGVRRLYTYRRIGDLPMVLALGVSTDTINSTWMSTAIIDGSIQMILCAATIALCFLFRREMAKRLHVERALRGAMDRLTRLATLDGLTGVGNRRVFEITYDVEWRRAQRGRKHLAILMLDADCFKLYNDRYGHPAGDLVLKAIAEAIQRAIRRPADFVARYGGEEFVVILPETDAAGAGAIAEKIREAVFALKIAHEGNPFGYVSVSIGMAVSDGGAALSRETILKWADEALYAAKSAGRNCTMIAGEGPNATSPPSLPMAIKANVSETADL